MVLERNTITTRIKVLAKVNYTIRAKEFYFLYI
jgi:hypothetical protein